MRHDYKMRQNEIAKAFSAASFASLVRGWYVDEGMSGQEIATRLQNATGDTFTPRTIQRIAKAGGYARDAGQSFRNAIARGRVEWAYKSDKTRRVKLAKAKRYEILKRDGFACVLCGATAKVALLEVDHIVARCNGGTNHSDNLRTLCHECNVGKRVVERER